ncbi:MAG: hypothetical protein ABIT70_05690 [Sulfuriferula sp.]
MLLLAACATETQLAPPIEVKVPVAVPCHAPAVPKPAWPMDILPDGASLYDQVKNLIAEIEARMAYEIQLESAVQVCQ